MRFQVVEGDQLGEVLLETDSLTEAKKRIKGVLHPDELLIVDTKTKMITQATTREADIIDNWVTFPAL